MLQAGQNPNLEASVVKDVGTTLRAGDSRDRPRAPRRRAHDSTSGSDFEQTLGYLVQHAPSFSLRGGTREVLRGIIARGLGLR